MAIKPAIALRVAMWMAPCSAALGTATIAGCSNASYGTSWQAVSPSRSPNAVRLTHVSPALLRRAKPPNCQTNSTAGLPETDTPAATADRNLVEIARLQVERDCLKEAELSVRRRLNKLQNSIVAAPGS